MLKLVINMGLKCRIVIQFESVFSKYLIITDKKTPTSMNKPGNYHLDQSPDKEINQ